MDPFSILPDELITTILLKAQPKDALSFSQTSRRHYRIASDDLIWLPFCFQIIHRYIEPDGAQHLGSEDALRSLKRGFADMLGESPESNIFYKFYQRYLGRYTWLLGWWVSGHSGQNHSALWHGFVRLQITSPVANPFDRSQFCNIVIGSVTAADADIPGFVSHNHPRVHVHHNDFPPFSQVLLVLGDVNGGLLVEGYHPMEFNRSMRPDALYFTVGLSGRVTTMSFFTPETVQKSELNWSFNRDDVAFSQRPYDAAYNDAPYPSPSLFPLLRDIQISTLSTSAAIPSLSFTFRPPSSMAQLTCLIGLKSPAEFPSNTTDLLATGMYVAPYSSHGLEYLYVRQRTITEEDLRANWPWEGSLRKPSEGFDLGPFSRAFRRASGHTTDISHISQDHVVVGARIVEVTKIIGDANVPKGQRTVIAFLDDPLVPSEALTDALAHLPNTPTYDPIVPPWPIDPEAFNSETEVELLQRKYAPRRGVDIPGVARIADTNFVCPRWTDCLMHVESRTQFAVHWLGLGCVSTFSKVDAW